MIKQMTARTGAASLDARLETCVRMEKPRVADGMGGFRDAPWTQGEEFDAVIVKEGAAQSSAAQQQREKARYSVTTPRGVGLRFHEVFLRKRDGAVFRMTGDSVGSETPAQASFQFEQSTAERWELD